MQGDPGGASRAARLLRAGGRGVGLGDRLRRLLGGRARLGVDELARRLGLEPDRLREATPVYRRFEIRKKGGGRRLIAAPDEATKALQRRILRRLLARLRAHPAATGFERGHSIVTNARVHAGRDVVVRFDLVDFFPSTAADRVGRFFGRLGWDREATAILVRITTDGGGLPQGAPTSPRLSNLLNVRLDARLAGLAAALGATYTRYADDLTFSMGFAPRAGTLVRAVRAVVEEEGYRLHRRRKLLVRRSHQRQVVTGLVVNEVVNLPRATRRRLRAVEHRLRATGTATLSPEQIVGWRALASMVERQREPPADA